MDLLILYFPLLWRFYMQGKVLPVYKQLRHVEIDLPTMDAAAADSAALASFTRKGRLPGALFLFQTSDVRTGKTPPGARPWPLRCR